MSTGPGRLRTLPQLIVLGVLAAAIFVPLFVAFYRMMRPDPRVLQEFARVQPGMSRQAVTARLGPPRKQSPKFHLTQYEGFERQYAEAAASRASYWLRWSTGFNTTLTVGFNADDLVMYKAMGDG